MRDLLQHLQRMGGECTRALLTSSYGEELVKEAVHRGNIKMAGNRDCLIAQLSERGKRIAEGLPGEAEKQLQFQVTLKELAEHYVDTKGLGELEHIEFRSTGAYITITIKG